MNLCKEILLGLFLLFTAFFIGRRLLALAAVVCDTHASFRIQQRELLNAKRQDRRYMPLSVLVEAGKDPKALLATLDSLQHQTYTLFEIVILEDSMAPAAVEALTKQLELLPLPQPVRRQLKCTPETAIYENCTGTVSLRLVRKSRTSLGDTWNLGVNIARYPYFTCIRAGTVLCQDSLDKLMGPFFQYRDTQAAGGSLQCAGITLTCPLSILETLEFDRSIPALQTLLQSRTLMLCGGPAAYRKDAAIEAGGFPARNIGLDQSLTLSIQRLFRKKKLPCRIVYIPEREGKLPPNGSFHQVLAHRRSWQQGMKLAMKDNRELLQLHRFGILALQYLLFLVFSLWAPLLAMLGVATVLFCLCLGLLDNGLLLQILVLSLLFKLLLSISAFQARAEDFSLVPKEIPRFFLLCLLGSTLYRLCITCSRIQGLFSRTKRQ